MILKDTVLTSRSPRLSLSWISQKNIKSKDDERSQMNYISFLLNTRSTKICIYIFGMSPAKYPMYIYIWPEKSSPKNERAYSYLQLPEFLIFSLQKICFFFNFLKIFFWIKTVCHLIDIDMMFPKRSSEFTLFRSKNLKNCKNVFSIFHLNIGF